jgi:two-component system cell cycle sensor histidine kinase/response regulator CckA
MKTDPANDLTGRGEPIAPAEHLARKAESLSIMAMGVAHDYNNLIAAILGNADLIQRKLAAGLPTGQNVELLNEAAALAAKLTYTGRTPLKPAAGDLNACVRAAAESIPALPAEAKLEYHLAESLPKARLDSERVHQVIVNLMENALEALAGQAGTVTVSTGSMLCDARDFDQPQNRPNLEPGSYVHIDVSDTGHGISPAIAERMFDPFFTTKIRGQGLGLSAVAGLMRAHKGAVQWWTSPGHGSTFRVLFPVVKA